MRAKPPKNKKKTDVKLLEKIARKQTERIYGEILTEVTQKSLPIIMLAVKDALDLDEKKMVKIQNKIEEYFNLYGDGLVSIDEIRSSLEVFKNEK